MGFVMIPGEDCCVLLSKPKGDDAVESSVKERLLRCSGGILFTAGKPVSFGSAAMEKVSRGGNPGISF